MIETAAISRTREQSRWARMLSNSLIVLVNLVGLAAFLYPFFLPEVNQDLATRDQDAPLVFAVLVVLSLTLLFAEFESAGMNTKIMAALGVLTAFNASLRLAETVTAVVNVGGFSPVFVLVVVSGYVYGARFGFILGALTMLVGGILTGGVGPWLPYQMFGAGWVGLTARWLTPFVAPKQEGRRPVVTRREVIVLALFGGAWGFLYGFLLNLYFWPFIAGPEMYYWSPGMGIQETLSHYLLFYGVTSFAWDAVRAGSTSLLLLFFGRAILKVLRRFHLRFHVQVEEQL